MLGFSWHRSNKVASCESFTGINIFESEAQIIANLALSSPGCETGGDLFGYFSPDASPVIFFAGAPGPEAERGVAHFKQDPDYQKTLFKYLASSFRLFYLGDWHSHHEFDLADPSVSDDSKICDLALKNNWQILHSIIIQTPRRERQGYPHWETRHQDDRRLSLGVIWNCFQYTFEGDRPSRRRIDIGFLPGVSPIRQSIDSSGRSIDPPIPSRRSPETWNYQRTQRSDYDLAGESRRIQSVGAQTLNILSLYKELSRSCTELLPDAEIEVEVADMDRPRLLSRAHGKTATCISVDGISSFQITISCDGRPVVGQVAFNQRISLEDPDTVKGAVDFIVCSLAPDLRSECNSAGSHRDCDSPGNDVGSDGLGAPSSAHKGTALGENKLAAIDSGTDETTNIR